MSQDQDGECGDEEVVEMTRWENGMELTKIEQLWLCDVLKDDVPRMIRVNGVVRTVYSSSNPWREIFRRLKILQIQNKKVQ